MSKHITLTVFVSLVLCSVMVAQTAKRARLQIRLTGAHPNGGPVRVAVWNDEATFLKGKPFRSAEVAPVGETIATSFNDLPVGKYAVTAYQDANNNGKLDTDSMGAPTEKYGFSNDARGAFGPPNFADASFTVGRGKTISFRLE